MVRGRLAALLLCLATAPAAAQQRTLEPPQLTIRPQAALAVFTGETVDLALGWRPVQDAARYRVAITSSQNQTTTVETTDLRAVQPGLVPGRYQATVTAIDATGKDGASSEPLPFNVIEIHAIPPGADAAMPPQRGAYAIGTRFSVAGMHCELSDAPVDDLLVGPENELRIGKPGLVTLRCAGIPGYLEKQVVIAPVTVASSSTVTRGETHDVSVTIASVAFVGDHLDVDAVGDLTLGDARRTDFGVAVPVHAGARATTAALRIQAGDFDLGRVELPLIDAPPPPPPAPHVRLDWRGLDLGGHAGAFLPPAGRKASTIGRPTSPDDAIGSGPLVGLRLGFFPTRRVGLEGEATFIEAGHGDNSGSSHVIASRLQLAVRALEAERLGLRLIAGSGTFTNLSDAGTAQLDTQAEVHAGAALSIETSPNLWLRFQFIDAVTTARDGGYAHCLELQLGVVTRVGRRDHF